MREYRSDAVDATFTVVQVNDGRYDPTQLDFETNPNIQYSETLVYLTPHIFYSIGREPDGEGDCYVPWLGYPFEQSSIPQTIRMLFPINENLHSEGYAIQVYDLFAALLGTRGVSVLFASGGDGVGEGDYLTEDESIQFIPLFPPTRRGGVFLRLGAVHKCESRTLTTSPRIGRSLPSAERRPLIRRSR